MRPESSGVRELEASLQQFGEFLLKTQLVKERAAPYCVRWVRRFLTQPASHEPLADRVRRFCEALEQGGRRSDWYRRPHTAIIDEQGRTDPMAAIEELRLRIRTRHDSYRTECSYADWVRRFFAYVSERQGAAHTRVDSAIVRDYLTYLAVRQQVSASTQNQALCALLFLCREVLGFDVEDVALNARATRGRRLPVVLSVPETAPFWTS